KSPHIAAEPRPSCSTISVGASPGLGPAMRYSIRDGGRSMKPWSASFAIASVYHDGSDAKILVLHVGRCGKRRRIARPHHLTALDDVVPVGDAGQRRDVLVDHQDRLAGGLEPRQARPDL